MEDIKRYNIYSKEDTFEHENTSGKYIKYSDHKAVVETLQNVINASKQQYIDDTRKMSTMRNKIEELEELNKSLKRCTNCDNQSICPIWSEDDEICGNWIAKGIK